jgi:hypothetical protein
MGKTSSGKGSARVFSMKIQTVKIKKQFDYEKMRLERASVLYHRTKTKNPSIFERMIKFWNFIQGCLFFGLFPIKPSEQEISRGSPRYDECYEDCWHLAESQIRYSKKKGGAFNSAGKKILKFNWRSFNKSTFFHVDYIETSMRLFLKGKTLHSSSSPQESSPNDVD